jgi:hypothetical protein
MALDASRSYAAACGPPPLCRRRQIADCHVLNHAAARGLISAIGKLLSEGLGFESPKSSQTGARYGDLSYAAAAASFNPQSIQTRPVPL